MYGPVRTVLRADGGYCLLWPDAKHKATDVESLWKLWRSASHKEVQTEADAVRAQAKGKVVANFCSQNRIGRILGFAKNGDSPLSRQQ